MARKKTKVASRRFRRWLSTGTVTGIFIVFLVYISNLPQPAASETVNVFNRTLVEAKTAKTSENQTQYTFYKELPELKVMVKEVAEHIPERVQAITDTAIDEPTDSKTVQAVYVKTPAIIQEKPVSIATIEQKKPEKSKKQLAQADKDSSEKMKVAQNTDKKLKDAFHSLAEADHRRAELLMMGLNARIKKTQAKGTTEYHVLVEPLAKNGGTETTWLAAK